MLKALIIAQHKLFSVINDPLAHKGRPDLAELCLEQLQKIESEIVALQAKSEISDHDTHKHTPARN